MTCELCSQWGAQTPQQLKHRIDQVRDAGASGPAFYACPQCGSTDCGTTANFVVEEAPWHAEPIWPWALALLLSFAAMVALYFAW